MNDYKDHIRRSLGLTEAQFIPASKLKTEDFPGIDPEDWAKAAKKEKGEHPQLSKADANLIAKQHLQKGRENEQAISPTGRPTPIIALGIRGSVTGGLPSGADQMGKDISPTKVGGYDRVTPQNLNSTLVDKTPSNPDIKQETNPIVNNPQTGQTVTHPHQIQVTAHEEPQATTGASTDSDSTLTLKSAIPKGIDVDIGEQGGAASGNEEEEDTKNEDNNTAMIPSTSLSETFERNKQLMREKLGLTKECATCGCGDPTDKHEDEDEGLDEDKKPRVCFHCKKPHPCACDKKDEEDAKLRRKNPEEYRKQFGMKVDKRSDLDPRDRGETVECKQCHNRFDYKLVSEVAMGAVQCPTCKATLDQSGTVLAEGKHKAGCQCGFCKNMGSFGKKKKEVEEGEDEDNQKDNPEFKEKDEKQFRKDRSASKAGDDVRAEFDKDKKEKMDEQQRIDESYAAPFQRMRSLAGVGNMILTSNGLFENKNEPGAAHPFNTNWKMDKEKAGFVKIDEEKLNKVKASLERKSKRGTLSDKELDLAKKLDEVLKRRQSKA